MKISDAARAEAEGRQPVWLDGDDGAQRGAGYRSGFVAGAEWAAARTEPELDRAVVGWQRTMAELSDAQKSLEAARRARASAEVQRRGAIVELAAARQEALEPRKFTGKAPKQATSEMPDPADALRLRPITVAARERLVVEVAEIIENASLQLAPDGESLIADSHLAANDVIRLMLASGARWRYWDSDTV